MSGADPDSSDRMRSDSTGGEAATGRALPGVAVVAAWCLTAVVAAWNIKDGTGNDDRIDEIALGVAWLDAEVIVLTEASKKSRMDLLVQQLNEFGCPML